MLEPQSPAARTSATPGSPIALALQLLVPVCLALSALTACGDDPAAPTADTAAPSDTSDTSVEVNEPDTSTPAGLTLTQVLPAEGKTTGLEEVSLVGRGLSKVVQVYFGDSVGVDPFPVSDSLLVVLSPPQARGLVDVTVVDDLGARATLPMAFTYVETVQVIAVEPTSGDIFGGERILIYGAGFSRESVVLIGGRKAVSTRFIDVNTLEVVTPEGEAGKADVNVSTPDGSGRLRRGFEYLPVDLPVGSLRVDQVSPAAGPATGGTRVTIDGSGFTQGLAVRIGALQATSVSVESATRIVATTAAGSPGRASVRVIGSGNAAALPNAFLYESEPALWVVDPPTGSVSGGARVRLHGAGFPDRVEVFFQGKPARDIVVVSETEILVTTPSNEVGPVEVEVRSTSLAAPLSAPGAYVYFDPAANPGTWGEPIDGTVNITVLDARSGGRVKGAFVMLGASTSTTYRGYANDNGQITFSGPDLVGDQTVTASFTGYQGFQLAGFDAENVTIPLEKAATCADIADMPCDSVTEPPPVATVVLEIVGSAKGPTMPFGACSDWTDAPEGLCSACASDAECGDGAICRELGAEGTFCSTACTTDVDCGSGFVCLDPTGMELEKRCVPPPGTPATYCDLTEGSLFDQVRIHYPGVWVPPSNRVQITSRLGDFAAFCWDGTEVRGNFRPHSLGVTRGLGAYRDGELVEAEVRIDIPLGRVVTIEVDRPTLSQLRNELASLRVGLNLGGDGTIEFPPQLAFTPRSFFLNLPSVSSAELYDARWELYAEVTVASLNGGSAAHEQGLTHIDQELDYLHTEGEWAPMVSPMNVTRGLATWQDGDGNETVVAVGEAGKILKRFGTTWARMPTDLPGTSARELVSIAVARTSGNEATSDAIVGGVAGLALHWNGLRWVTEPTGVVAPVSAIDFGDGKVAWAVAGRSVLRWDGDVWTRVLEADTSLFAVSATSATEAWVAGEAGTLGLVTYDETNPQLVSFTSGDKTFRALWRDGQRLLAVGDGGAAASFDGATWTSESTGTEYDLLALGGDGVDLWAVGSRATMLRRDASGVWSDETHGQTKGTLRAIGGAEGEVLAMGSHEFVMGPLLGIPENLTPPPGSLLSRLTWESKTGLDADFTVIEFGAETGPCSACGMLFMIPYIGWRTVLDGDLFAADFPNLRGIANTASAITGFSAMTMYRVRTEDGFDFDHTASTGFFGGLWKAWSWRSEAFIR